MTCWKSFLALSNSFILHNASPLRNRAFSLAASNSRAYGHTENDEKLTIFNMELMLLIASNTICTRHSPTVFNHNNKPNHCEVLDTYKHFSVDPVII